jgi:hypothetical protein
MIPKPLQEVMEADLLALIDQGREEGPRLDFKRDLPKEDHDGRKAFYADVCAFANSSGGDLVYGVEEKAGVASMLVSQAIPGSVDGYVLKLTNSMRDRIEPILHGVHIHPVPLTGGGHALVIRVPRSFSGIHRSKVDAQFYVRKSRSNEALDVPGIVSRVADNLGREDRVSSFFARRYADILTNEQPLPLGPGPKLVVHLVPARDFLSGEEIDLGALPGHGPVPALYDSLGSSSRNTSDGKAYFSTEERTANCFTLFMRSGVVEACMDLIPNHFPEQHRNVDLKWIEECVLNFLHSFQSDHFAAHSTDYPFVVRVALLGTNNLPFSSGARYGHRQDPQGLPVRQPLPVLVLPEILIEGPDARIPHEMHSAFLRMWHAWAFTKCLYYEFRDGIWSRPKRA